MFEYLKRERVAFELFKAAYRASFPAGAAALPCAELNIAAAKLAAEDDASLASASLFLVVLDETLFASPQEGKFAEIEWL